MKIELIVIIGLVAGLLSLVYIVVYTVYEYQKTFRREFRQFFGVNYPVITEAREVIKPVVLGRLFVYQYTADLYKQPNITCMDVRQMGLRPAFSYKRAECPINIEEISQKAYRLAERAGFCKDMKYMEVGGVHVEQN